MTPRDILLAAWHKPMTDNHLSEGNPPSQRPQCKGCERLLVPRHSKVYREIRTPRPEAEIEAERAQRERTRSSQSVSTESIRSEWTGEKKFDGYLEYRGFCTLRCAARFAECAFENGFRVHGGAK